MRFYHLIFIVFIYKMCKLFALKIGGIRSPVCPERVKGGLNREKSKATRVIIDIKSTGNQLNNLILSKKNFY